MIDLLPKNIPYASLKRRNIRNQCFRQLIDYVSRECPAYRKGLKYNDAIRLFAEKNNFIIPKNISLKDWVLTVFFDESVLFFGKNIVTKRRKTKLKDSKKKYNSFLQSPYWKEVRDLVLKRDEYKCKCGAKTYLQVHHLTYENHLNEKNNLQDLITVCRKCHKEIHGIK